MNTITRRVTAAVVCLALPLGLAACGDDDDDTATSDAASTDTTVAVDSSTTTAAAADGEATIVVAGVWARTSAEGQTTGAAYMTITGGAEGDRLVAAAAPTTVAAETQIHEVVPAEDATDAMDMGESTDEGMPGMEDATDSMGDMGAMTMQQVEFIEIPAGGTVTLEPGGYHVMLLDLVEPLVAGDAFDLELTFENAGVQTVTVEVRDNA